MGHLHAVEVAAALALGDAAVVGEGHVPAVDHILNQGGPIVCRRRQAGIAAGEGWETRSAKQYFSAVLPPPLHCYSGLWQPGSSRELQGSAAQRSAASFCREAYKVYHATCLRSPASLGRPARAGCGCRWCRALRHRRGGRDRAAKGVMHMAAQPKDSAGLATGCWVVDAGQQDGKVPPSVRQRHLCKAARQTEQQPRT